MAKRVYVSRKILPPAFDLLKSRYEVTSWNSDDVVPREVLLKEVETVDALYCCGTDKIDDELLDRGKNLKVIATMSVGYNHIDVAACRRRGVLLGYTPDVLTEACAELAVGLVLCTTRRLIEANRHVHSGEWKGWYITYMCGRGIADSTVGIVGMGRIGYSIAEKLKSFHPKAIIYHNRKPSEKGEALGAQYVPNMDELLKRSDFIICSAALTKETTRMFNREKFSLMKPTAQFFNISRGDLVDQDALYDVLANGKLLAAGLDVCTPEPLPTDHRLLKLPNFVLLPHIGSATFETRLRMATLTSENIIAGLDGRPLPASIPE